MRPHGRSTGEISEIVILIGANGRVKCNRNLLGSAKNITRRPKKHLHLETTYYELIDIFDTWGQFRVHYIVISNGKIRNMREFRVPNFGHTIHVVIYLCREIMASYWKQVSRIGDNFPLTWVQKRIVPGAATLIGSITLKDLWPSGHKKRKRER